MCLDFLQGLAEAFPRFLHAVHTHSSFGLFHVFSPGGGSTWYCRVEKTQVFVLSLPVLTVTGRHP